MAKTALTRTFNGLRKPYRCCGVFARLEEPAYFKRIRIVERSICWPVIPFEAYGQLKPYPAIDHF